MYCRKIMALMLVAGQAAAWNSMGHRLVAQIAVDQLPASYVKRLNHLSHEMDVVYPPRKLVNSSTWLDEIRFNDNQWYTTYHYEDSYFSDDGTPLPIQSGHYASWALKTAIRSLENYKTTPFNKAISLRIVMHVVGDIHQPLHSIAKVSKANPKGDSGGNFYILDDNPVGKSLHTYWDNGGGYLMRDQPVRYHEVVDVAREIERKYPCSSLPLGNVTISEWLDESRKVALEEIYGPLKGKSNIPDGYQMNTQKTVQYQIAMAGCRLAKLLKETKVVYRG